MRNSFTLIFVILILLVLGCVCGKSSNNVDNPSQTKTTVTPTPSPTPIIESVPSLDLNNPQIIEKVNKGKQIYKSIESQYNLPVMFTWQAESIMLAIPTKNWNSLSKQDKVNLTYYAQKVVLEIQENPKPYVDRWTTYYKATEKLERGGEFDGLTQRSYMEQATNLCDNCWRILTGTVKGNGFYEDEVVVYSGNVNEFRQLNEL